MPTAMITGGASWFSRETAKILLKEGWDLALSDINQQNLDEVKKELGNPPNVSTGILNVTDLDAVRKYVDALAAKGRIDALVNVAGGSNYLGVARKPFHETTPEYWTQIIQPNIYGVLNCCHSVLPHMIAAKGGAIVNIASGMGLRGQARMALYSAAKGAIVLFTQAVCREVGQYGIRVNSIAPGSAESRWAPNIEGGTHQNQSPLGRRTSALDVANAITFLLSDKASHITGSCMDISGGSSLH